MPRKKHKWYIGAMLHVTARGNHKSNIFKDETDYKLYLYYVKEAIEYYDNKHYIIAYVLMTNHVHLVIETTDCDISDFIKRVHGRYAENFNKKYDCTGHLFQGRYNSELIGDENYMLEVSRYVHLNPVRAKMVEKPEDYRWSSYTMYTGEKDEKLITSKRVLSYFKEKGLYKKFVESAMGPDPWVIM
ncbi:transposase [Clostridium bowmanii]|uniref:transposase n=1 Tax=Clostridium bowmanii TaxID=132925 RepID=UPI001C0C87B7|nr:transposase [Clostridium bowmanii]MBU3190633.1 transposase [Clostridium bowmanii]MCA1072529.1 transposase [Clostridium bowmanii]